MSEYNADRVKSGLIQEWMLREATACWQSAHGLVADGLLGPNTEQAMVDAREDDIEGDCPELSKGALCVARSDVGKGEEGGNNSGPYVEMLFGKTYDGDDDDDGAWCAAFVSHCFEVASKELNIELPIKLSYGAKALYSSFPIKSKTPNAGDVVCWDRGPLNADGTKSWQGHIGIVERVDGQIFHTIEGNVGSYPAKVRRFQYDLETQTRLEGFGRLDD